MTLAEDSLLGGIGNQIVVIFSYFSDTLFKIMRIVVCNISGSRPKVIESREK